MLFFMMLFLASACRDSGEEIITFKENGSWCWFQDERAIIHNNQLIIGSVADRYGKNGEAIDGNIDVKPEVVQEADIAILSVHRYPLGSKLYNASEFKKNIAQEIELELSLAGLKKGGFNVLGHPGGIAV